MTGADTNQMAYGDVLAGPVGDDDEMERIRNADHEAGRRSVLRRSKLRVWTWFAVSLLIVVAIGEESMQGGHAVAFLLAFLSTLISFPIAAIVSLYSVYRWARGGIEKTRTQGPQDAVATTVLHSTSVRSMIPLGVFVVVCLGAVASSLGGWGFLAAFGVAIVFVLNAASGVLSQRVEVRPEAVQLHTKNDKRTIPATEIASIDFSPHRRVVIEIVDESPVYLAGNFIADKQRAAQFVADARRILRLDTPSDAPAPPRPQDATY